MSTAFKSRKSPLLVTGLPQSKSYNEGDAQLLLDAVSFSYVNNYADVATVTIDITGGDTSQIELVSTSEVAPITKVSNAQYTISSQYQKSGVTQNLWADVISTMANMKLTFNNNDASDDYVLTVQVLIGNSGYSHTITVTGFAVVDATNIVQNLTIDEDSRIWSFDPASTWNTGALTPQIADLDEAGRTYRVTITSPAEAAILYCYSAYAVGASTYEPIVVLEGTQTQINEAILGTSTLYVMSGPDNVDPFAITWQQEVISGAVGVPYIQETGSFNYTVINVNAVDTAIANFNYSEDTPTAPFSIATVNDTRKRTTGLTDLNNYEATITLSNAASGSIDGWVDQGAGVYTTTLNNYFVGMQTALNNVIFLPSVDYTSSSDTATLTLTRGHQKGDPTWYILPNTNRQTLINAASITMTNVAVDLDAGYSVDLGPHDWIQHSNTNIAFANITDTRGDYPTVTYRVTIQLVAPATNANGELRTFGTGGGTSVWNGITQLTIEGDKAQVNSHLATLEWWSRGALDAFTTNVIIDRNINASGYATVNASVVSFNAGTTLASPTNTTLSWIYNEDEDTAFSEGDTKTI